VIALFLLLGCGGSGDTGAPDTVDQCEDAPVLTWENFGRGFLVENCQSCHGSTAPYRSQTDSPPPDTVTFDTQEQAQSLRALILAASTGDTPSMPPRGGVSEVDREKLDIWLNCWEGE